VVGELRRLAAERHVDVLVVGSSPRSLFDRLLAPSVSKGLAKDAPCPVLLVH
jgi:nucleotide-binding universal stress UspA family protein